MGTLTQAELKTEIKAGLGNRSDLDDRLTSVLNIIQQSAVRAAAAEKINFEELQATKTFSTVASTQDYTFESIETGLNPRTVFSLKIVQSGSPGESQRLLRVTPGKMDELVPDALLQGESRPTHYVEWNNKISLYRIPDIVYNMEMKLYRWPTPFVEATDTQVSDLDNKDDVLIYGALEYLYRSLGEEDAAKMMFVKYQRELGLSQDENEAEADDQIVGVLDPHGRRGYGGGVHSGDYWKQPLVKRVR